MYSIGDLIVYGRTGVCRVEEIRNRRPGSEGKKMCYVLKPLYQSCMISTPVDNKKVVSRPIISREEARRLIECIPAMKAEAYHNRNLNQLREHYNETITGMDCASLAKMTKSIRAKRREAVEMKRKLGAVDERFLREAEELLFGELAAALEIPLEEVGKLIKKRAERGGELT